MNFINKIVSLKKTKTVCHSWALALKIRRHSICLDELHSSHMNLSLPINILTFRLPASHLQREQQKHTTSLWLSATQRLHMKKNRECDWSRSMKNNLQFHQFHHVIMIRYHVDWRRRVGVIQTQYDICEQNIWFYEKPKRQRTIICLHSGKSDYKSGCRTLAWSW